MGLSFHNETSLEEAVSTLQFNAVDSPNSTLGRGTRIGDDGRLRSELDDPNAGLEIVNISQERRDDV